MTHPPPPKEASLWRESYAGCRNAAKTLWPWVVGAGCLFAPAEYSVMQDKIHVLAQALDQLRSGDFDVNSLSGGENHHALSSFYIALLQFFSIYVFMALFLKKEPITVPPHFGFKGFFYWFRQVMKKILILAGILFAGAVITIVFGFFISFFSEAVKTDVMITAAVGLTGGLVYAFVKWSLLSPLAVSGIKPVLKPSWFLTDGKWWRLGWQWFVFDFFILLGCMAMLFVMSGVLYMLGNDLESDAFVLDFALLLAAYKAVLLAANCVFMCTAGRIFAEEKRAVDPTFKLITSV